MLSDLKASNNRYERKFSIYDLSREEIESTIKMHPSLFREIFYERQINNIYLDTEMHTNFWQNVVGSAERYKIRIRWYGETFGNISKPVLEIKTKSGLVGGKFSYPLASFSMIDEVSDSIIQGVFDNSDLPLVLRAELKNMKMSLLNKYSRKYFISGDSFYRLTLDSNISYWKLNSNHNFFLNKVANYAQYVVELKYEINSDHADKVSNWFRFRMTRNSKYVNGLINTSIG